MADTIPSTALTTLTVDKTKTFVLSGGVLGLLADGGAYPADLKQIPLKKISIKVEPEFGQIMGKDATTDVLVVVRTWVKSVKRSFTVETEEALNASVLALFNSGYFHGKMKLRARDPQDATGQTVLMMGEFTGSLAINGGIDADQGEAASPVSLEGTAEGVCTLAANASIT